jgi:Na+/H+-dicarboxylate symporter
VAMLDMLINHLLKLITCLVPFFVAGFIVKLNHDNTMTTIIKNYALIFGVIGLAVFTYIAFLYLLSSRFILSRSINALKNMVPAAIAGFSTMSSASAMPLTIIAAEKNAQNKDLAQSIIPATVNIHLIGDCFAIPILAFAILKSFGYVEPGFYQYLIFTCYFVLAKFSVAGVPGGGIIVMLPVLEGYLGFNAPMLSLITALYILFDPVITCANVLGNGGFAMLMDRIGSKLNVLSFYSEQTYNYIKLALKERKWTKEL